VHPLRLLLWLVTASALVIGLGACAATDPSATAADVNGSLVTPGQLDTAAGVFRSVYGVQQQSVCGTEDGPTDTPEAACNRLALTALVLFQLSDSYAADHGIVVPDSDVTTAIQRFESSYGKDVLQQQLDANGVTSEDFAHLMRESIVQNEVAKALYEAKLEQQQGGVRAAYRQSLGDYTIVQVDHILVKTRAEAEQAYQQVTAPGATRNDFLALAKRISIDPSVKQNGGSLGSAYAATYTPEFANAVVNMQPGEISNPVHTTFGWHVIRMEAKQVTPFAKAKDQILQKGSGPAFHDWATGFAAGEAIDVNPTFGRWDEVQLAVVRVTSTDPSATDSPESPVDVATPTG
jgi:parvulin-like peptidyl-prolyl isomerase